MAKETPNLLSDGVGPIDAGINSGIAPIRLDADQAAFATNVTFRGGFAHTRPPFNKQDLDFAGNVSLESIFSTQLFQGAVTYLDDFGNTFIVASIGGVVVLLTPRTSQPWLVTDVSILGDPNSSNSSQVFLWQSEKWIIIEDGVNLPIFFDGTTSRRSLGASQIVSTITGGPYRVTAADGTDLLSVTITTPYGGMVNVPIRRNSNGAIYQVINNTITPTGLQAIITPIAQAGIATGGNAGTLIPAGTGLIVPAVPRQAYFPLLAPLIYNPQNPFDPRNQNAQYEAFRNPFKSSTAKINFPTMTPGGYKGFGIPGTTFSQYYTLISIGGIIFWIDNARTQADPSPTTFYVNTLGGAPFPTIPAGTIVYGPEPPKPAYPVATVRTAFNLPALNVPLKIDINEAYVGDVKNVIISGITNSIGQVIPLTIKAVVPTAPTNGITITNTNDIPFGSPDTVDIAAGETFSTLAELPIGRMGIYGRGRNWIVLQDGRSFVAGDIVGGASGTVAFASRDAVLRLTENDQLAGGGSFSVPGTAGEIKAIKLCAQLDASLGNGPVQVFTPELVFSCDAPLDRTKWSTVTNPILSESLIGTGALSQNSTIAVNSDTLFRSIAGVSSLILARRNFDSWGNVPQSREVEIVMAQDAGNLLQFSSAIVFDNRMLMTCFPGQGPLGVYHQGMVVMDLAPISSLRGKAASIWEGYWSGLNALQLLTAQFNFTQRAFSFCYSVTDAQIQLFELLPEENTLKWDNGTSPIQSSFETPVLFRPKSVQNMPFYRLEDGEIWVENLFGVVSFAVWFRPNDSTCWTFWHGWSVCSDPNLASGIPQYRPSMGFGEPPNDCDPVLETLRREAYYFQLRVQVTGNCTVKFVGVKASLQPQPKYARIICSDITP